jgi:hypothetical protein
MTSTEKLCMTAEQTVGKFASPLSAENCPIRSTAAPQLVALTKGTQAAAVKGFLELYSASKASISYY